MGSRVYAFANAMSKLESDSSISTGNKKVIMSYIKLKQSENLTYSRMVRITGVMKYIVGNFSFDLSMLNQEQLQDIVIAINGNGRWMDWTKFSNINVLKNFVRWLNKQYKLGLEIEEIRNHRPKNQMMPEYLITKEEFNRLINTTDDLQTKLLIGLLYESGARIGELLTLRLQNVTFSQYGARLLVHGKTGQRIIPIVWYANLLRQFMESHPLKDAPASILWYFQECGNIGPMNYDIVRMRLKRLAKKAGIKKDIHPHLFRHTRMTELAKDLPEQTLKVLAGWSKDSKMASTYVHMANKDVEDGLLSKVYGIKTDEVSTKERLKQCIKCAEINPYFAKICQRCNTPLDAKELLQGILAEERPKEVEDWSKTLIAFLKVVEKKHPDIWDDMKEILDKSR